MANADLMTPEEARSIQFTAALLRDIQKRAEQYDRLRALDPFDAARLGRVTEALDAADDALFNAMNTAATYGGCAAADAVTDDWQMRRAQS